MCTNVFKEVASHYNSKGSNVYACLVDASKAFDRVNYEKLFQLVLKRNLPGVIIRFLLDAYTRQYAYIKWEGEFSDVIHMHNGVKQGGVLSATLFCIYMDELMSRLEQTGVGCYIGNSFYGGLSYADDLKLMCPSVSGLQKLLKTCEEFGIEYSVTYNAKKTICICYGVSKCDSIRRLCLYGNHLSWESSVKYLGNIHTSTMCDNKDINYQRGIYISAVNRLNSQFSMTPVNVKATLLQTYCSAWYGSQTWPLHSAAVGRFNTEWNKAVRRTLRLPYKTRTRLLPHLVGNDNFVTQIEKRWLRLFHSMLGSKNDKISYIAKKSVQNAIGVLGQNRIFLALKYNVRDICEIKNLPASCCGRDAADSELISRVQQIKELLSAREGHCTIDVLDGETDFILEYLCTY